MPCEKIVRFFTLTKEMQRQLLKIDGQTARSVPTGIQAIFSTCAHAKISFYMSN